MNGIRAVKRARTRVNNYTPPSFGIISKSEGGLKYVDELKATSNMRKYVSKYNISIFEKDFPAHNGKDGTGWSFEDMRFVLEFLDNAERSTIMKLLERFKIRFIDGNENVDEETMVNILFADSKAEELISEIKELQK